MTAILLAIDQGTTGSTAAFFDYESLEILANAKVEFPQIFPSPGLVEHSPDDIWRSVLAAISQATELMGHEHPGRNLTQLRAIGITNQRETVVPWNRHTGEVVGNAIVWQDRRTAAQCDSMKSDGGLRRNILERTGLVCDPYFSATKMAWILKNNATAKRLAQKGDLILGTVDSWILYKLTGGVVVATEHTNASRTMLYDLREGSYSQELSACFEVPLSALPEIHPSSFHFGVTRGVGVLPDGVPITGVLGDQQAALFGQNCRAAGEAKITYGTGAFLLMHTGDQPMVSDSGLLATVAASTAQGRTFAVEGAAFIAGAAVQFLRDNFAWIANSAESETMARALPRDENLLFVPALAGLAAPYWNPNAKGVLFGMTRGSRKGQIIRAVLESIALQNVQLLHLMEQVSGVRLRHVGVDGGASRNNLLMQFQADMLRICLARPENIETTAKGAVMAARLGLDPSTQWSSRENGVSFAPQMEEGESGTILRRWLAAVDAVNAFYSSMM
jgi:glycerol kinase